MRSACVCHACHAGAVRERSESTQCQASQRQPQSSRAAVARGAGACRDQAKWRTEPESDPQWLAHSIAAVAASSASEPSVAGDELGRGAPCAISGAFVAGDGATSSGCQKAHSALLVSHTRFHDQVRSPRRPSQVRRAWGSRGSEVVRQVVEWSSIFRICRPPMADSGREPTIPDGQDEHIASSVRHPMRQSSPTNPAAWAPRARARR